MRYEVSSSIGEGIFAESLHQEAARIRFLECSRGPESALAFAERTRSIYRRAVVKRSAPAANAVFRLRLMASYCYLKRYLQFLGSVSEVNAMEQNVAVDCTHSEGHRAANPSAASYVCTVCGWIYDEGMGVPAVGIAPGTRWEDVPEEFLCLEFGEGKNAFERVEV